MLFCAFYLDGYEPDLIKDDDTPPSARELTMLLLPDKFVRQRVSSCVKRQRPARHLAVHVMQLT